MAGRYWMADVAKKIKRKGTKGALTRQASARGESVTEFCSHSHKGKTSKRCGIAKAFRHAKHSGRGRS